MKFNVILLAMGLHSAVVGADYYDERQREDAREIESIKQESDRLKAEHDEYIQRTQPVQVIEPGGVRTFYPGTDGTWVTYNPPLRSRR